MPIEMPRGLPFAVDTWTAASARKRHRFLTHAHRDHLAGATTASVASPVYATRVTILLALHLFAQLDRDTFVEVEAGAPVLVRDPDGDFTVTAFDANHCPGAVMFLFEGAFGTVLHTGDCRLTPACLLPLQAPPRRIDYLFLDCTFARCPLKFPTKESAIRQVISCIRKEPDAPVVYLACDMLGQEEILVHVSKAFGSKIHVDKAKNSECYYALSLVAPEILSDDASCRFQVIGFPRLSERATEIAAAARADRRPAPLFIRPSSQWYANYAQPEASRKRTPALTEPERDEHGVWHVCYSMHSSRGELERALWSLRPKWVVSTTPPCLAMDLAYVKNHCFRTRLAPDDPLWALLGVANGKTTVTGLPPQPPPSVEAVEKDGDGCSFIKEAASEGCQVQEGEPLLKDMEVQAEQPVTLFGRARFGLLQEHELWEGYDIDAEVIEEAKLESKEQNLTTESALCEDERSKEAVEVIDEAKFEGKEQTSIIEPEFFEDGRPKEAVKAIDEAETCAKAIEEAKFEAKERVSTTESAFSEYGRAKEDVEGKEESSGVDHLLLLHKNSTDALKECNDVPSETGKKICEVAERASDLSCAVGSSSKGLNANLRRLYRSMNVPVPRPLPSLVELMGASKRVKISSLSHL